MFIGPLIERKRNGHPLTPDEWRALVSAYTAGDVPDYQMAALLMAVVFRGLEEEELESLLGAMLDSGNRLAFGAGTPSRVDKHSTGGVGDKVSLILAPAVAALGVAVPMMSGRGLGHTGGTLDKLESIPGFRTGLTLEEARAQVERIGCAMFGQTPEIAPADRKMYALRDATATVPAIPLIAASILSKKLAEDLQGLVLDVKRGSGAQLPELDDALDLAQTMVRLGEMAGCRTVALLTAMDQPLGSACGNALEVREAISVLRGEGPEDVRRLVVELGAEMLVLGEATPDVATGREKVAASLDRGAAAELFATVLDAQGGDGRVLDDLDRLPAAPVVTPCTAARAGVVVAIDTAAVGRTVNQLGGGRKVIEDRIDPAVGVVMQVCVGDQVAAGDQLVAIHARTDGDARGAVVALSAAITIGERDAHPLPLISHRVTAAGVEERAVAR